MFTVLIRNMSTLCVVALSSTARGDHRQLAAYDPRLEYDVQFPVGLHQRARDNTDMIIESGS